MKFPMAAGGPVIALLLVWIYSQMQGAEFGWIFLVLAVIFAVAGTLWPHRFAGQGGRFLGREASRPRLPLRRGR